MTPITTLFAATCKPTFFGLVPWYQYLTLDGSCNITNFHVLTTGGAASSIPLILLAIVDDLLRVAGIAAVFYVIFAGVKYVTSQGDPQQAASALGTLTNALIGLAIAIFAIVAVSYLGTVLGGT
jgi:hypothetical protein